MKLSRMLKSSVFNLYFLFFLNGFLLCMLINFQLADNYEKRIFSNLAHNISARTNHLPEDSVLTQMLRATHFLVGTRSSIFTTDMINPSSTTEDYATSLTGDLMTAQGACGSYSKVMVKLAQQLNFECRIGQMKVNGAFGGHIIPEIKTTKGWVVMDPMYNLLFKKSTGEPASFEEVSKNWNYYQKQLPAGYNNDYRYEDVRYTNWDKIPVILPFVRKVIDNLIGEQRTNQICIRVNLLSIYNVYSVFLLIIILPLSLFLLRKIFRRHRLTFYSGYNWQGARLPVLARTLVKSDKTA